MAWTDEQRAELVEAYWADETLRCPDPDCNTRLKVNCDQGGGEYILHVSCPRGCDRFAQGLAEDPKRDTFRDWTEAECKKVIDDHFEDGTAACPVDGVTLQIKENQFLDGSNTVNVLCLRCHRGFAKTFPLKK